MEKDPVKKHIIECIQFLKQERLKLTWSTKKCADAMNIDPALLSKYENGSRKITLEHIILYGGILGFSMVPMKN